MKPRRLPRQAFYLIAVLLQISFVTHGAMGQSGGFTITPIVVRGDPSPDGGTFFPCIDYCGGRISGSHAFTNRGAVGVLADTQLNCPPELFLLAPEEKVLIASPCQEVPLGRLIFANDLNINNQGQAAFAAGWSKDGRNDSGLVFYSQGRLTKIAALGDPTPNGAIFKDGGFSEPSINNNGDVAFGAAATDNQGLGHDGIFLFSGGELRTLVQSGDPSPIGGVLAIGFLPPSYGMLNNKTEALFEAWAFYGSPIPDKLGLFLATRDGVRKIVTESEQMPNDSIVFPRSLGIGDLNDKSEVAFTVKLQGKADTGIFLNSGGVISKIMAQGDPTPIGGTFSTLEDPELIERFLFVRPRINNNSAVAFKAKVNNNGTQVALFLASPKAMLKVIAVGDQLSSGETVRVIDSFALNDLGQVAFFAYGKKKKDGDLHDPLGVYVATPTTPRITSIKLKSKKGSLQLRVSGNGMITNDTVIEINGVPLGAIDYPSDSREDGGATTQLVSRDGRLEQLIPSGQTVQVTVYNSLTNLRSNPVSLTRSN